MRRHKHTRKEFAHLRKLLIQDLRTNPALDMSRWARDHNVGKTAVHDWINIAEGRPPAYQIAKEKKAREGKPSVTFYEVPEEETTTRAAPTAKAPVGVPDDINVAIAEWTKILVAARSVEPLEADNKNLRNKLAAALNDLAVIQHDAAERKQQANAYRIALNQGAINKPLE